MISMRTTLESANSHPHWTSGTEGVKEVACAKPRGNTLRSDRFAVREVARFLLQATGRAFKMNVKELVGKNISTLYTQSMQKTSYGSQEIWSTLLVICHTKFFLISSSVLSIPSISSFLAISRQRDRRTVAEFP